MSKTRFHAFTKAGTSSDAVLTYCVKGDLYRTIVFDTSTGNVSTELENVLTEQQAQEHHNERVENLRSGVGGEFTTEKVNPPGDGA